MEAIVCPLRSWFGFMLRILVDLLRTLLNTVQMSSWNSHALELEAMLVRGVARDEATGKIQQAAQGYPAPGIAWVAAPPRKDVTGARIPIQEAGIDHTANGHCRGPLPRGGQPGLCVGPILRIFECIRLAHSCTHVDIQRHAAELRRDAVPTLKRKYGFLYTCRAILPLIPWIVRVIRRTPRVAVRRPECGAACDVRAVIHETVLAAWVLAVAIHTREVRFRFAWAPTEVDLPVLCLRCFGNLLSGPVMMVASGLTASSQLQHGQTAIACEALVVGLQFKIAEISMHNAACNRRKDKFAD